MIREIVKIDRDKCNGCGNCVPGCHEGALQMIDGKATLVSELMCDGLGACLGHCPVGAITIEKREAEAYNEAATIAAMVPNGANVIIAHLKHLFDHREFEYARVGIEYLKKNEDTLPFNLNHVLQAVYGDKSTEPKQQLKPEAEPLACGCPGSAARSFAAAQPVKSAVTNSQPSMLTHWPIQMHLINPAAAHFKGSNLLLAADCVAFSLGNFHTNYLQNKTLAIACPKLDANKEVYVDKIVALVENAEIDTLTIMKMEVPCCHGLVQIAQMALNQCSRKVPVKVITVGVQGDIVDSKWL